MGVSLLQSDSHSICGAVYRVCEQVYSTAEGSIPESISSVLLSAGGAVAGGLFPPLFCSKVLRFKSILSVYPVCLAEIALSSYFELTGLKVGSIAVGTLLSIGLGVESAIAGRPRNEISLGTTTATLAGTTAYLLNATATALAGDYAVGVDVLTNTGVFALSYLIGRVAAPHFENDKTLTPDAS